MINDIQDIEYKGLLLTVIGKYHEPERIIYKIIAPHTFTIKEILYDDCDIKDVIYALNKESENEIQTLVLKNYQN